MRRPLATTLRLGAPSCIVKFIKALARMHTSQGYLIGFSGISPAFRLLPGDHTIKRAASAAEGEL